MSFNRNISELKLWCQAVLPLVYDDSLSYYELLCKVVHKLNETIDLANKLNSEWNDIKGTALQLIIDYVNEQIENGTIGTIIEEATKEKFAELEKELNTLSKTVTDNKSDADSKISELNATVTNNYNDLNDRITLLTDKVYVFIGDSWSIQFYNNTMGWMSEVKNLLGNPTVYMAGAGGYGFSSNAAGTFLSLLQGLDSTINEKLAVTDIVVLGGINDRGTSDIIPGIGNFMTYAKTNYPNANVKIGCLGWITNYGEAYKVASNSYQSYVWGALTYGATYINTEYLAHNYAWFQSDGSHLTDTGIQEISIGIANILRGGSPTNRTYWSSIDRYAEPLNNKWVDKTGAFLSSMYNGICTFTMPSAINCKFNTPINLQNNASQNVFSFTANTGFFNGNCIFGFTNTVTSCGVYYDSGTKFTMINVGIEMKAVNDSCAIEIRPYIDATLNNVTEIVLAPFQFSQLWWSC